MKTSQALQFVFYSYGQYLNINDKNGPLCHSNFKHFFLETFKKSLSYLKWIDLVNFNQMSKPSSLQGHQLGDGPLKSGDGQWEHD